RTAWSRLRAPKERLLRHCATAPPRFPNDRAHSRRVLFDSASALGSALPQNVTCSPPSGGSRISDGWPTIVPETPIGLIHGLNKSEMASILDAGPAIRSMKIIANTLEEGSLT